MSQQKSEQTYQQKETRKKLSRQDAMGPVVLQEKLTHSLRQLQKPDSAEKRAERKADIESHELHMTDVNNDLVSDIDQLKIKAIECLESCLKCVAELDWKPLCNMATHSREFKSNLRGYIKENKSLFERLRYLEYYIEFAIYQYKSVDEMHEKLIIPVEYKEGAFPQLKSVICGFHDSVFLLDKFESSINGNISELIDIVKGEDDKE